MAAWALPGGCVAAGAAGSPGGPEPRLLGACLGSRSVFGGGGTGTAPISQMRKQRPGEAGAPTWPLGPEPGACASKCGKEEAERKGCPPEAWRFPFGGRRKRRKRRRAQQEAAGQEGQPPLARIDRGWSPASATL